MQWIPTAERLPTVDDFKETLPYWKGYDGYIEGRVVLTVKVKRKPVVMFGWCVIPAPYADGTPGVPWFSDVNGQSIECDPDCTITAWSPVDVPGPYQENDE